MQRNFNPKKARSKVARHLQATIYIRVRKYTDFIYTFSLK